MHGTPATPTTAPPSVAPTVAIPSYKFNAARWSRADRITGIASIILFISLFLPWFGVSVTAFNITISGLTAHGFLYIVLFVVVALIVYLWARAGWDKLPISMKLAHNPVMFVASLTNLLLVVLAFILKTGGPGVGWRFGSFLALAAALVAAGPLAIQAIRARAS